MFDDGDERAKPALVGVLTKVPYSDHPPRYDYQLTDTGRDLWPVLTTIRQWGDKVRRPGRSIAARAAHERWTDLTGGVHVLLLR
jgi:DNA-binding HxlR family transcriptional regulator